jgi:hypothetical protein
LPLPSDFPIERDLPVPAVRVVSVEAFRAVFLPAAVPVAPLPAAVVRVVLPAVVRAAVFSAVDFGTAVLEAVVLRAAFVPGEEVFGEDVLDFPEAGTALRADAGPAVFFAATAVLPADFPVACFVVADFVVVREEAVLPLPRFADGVVDVPLRAVVFLPVVAAPPVDFIGRPAPLPRVAAALPVLAAVVVGFCRDVVLPDVLARLRVAVFPVALLAAVLLVFLAADLLAPVVLRTAFRGLVVAMRLSRRNPLRCLLQRLLR